MLLLLLLLMMMMMMITTLMERAELLGADLLKLCAHDEYIASTMLHNMICVLLYCAGRAFVYRACLSAWSTASRLRRHRHYVLKKSVCYVPSEHERKSALSAEHT